MSGAPDKIWVEDTSKDWFDDSGVWVVDQENQYDVGYTRSDIADELQAEVARLRELLGEFARFASKDGLGASVPFGQSKLHKARAALEYKD